MSAVKAAVAVILCIACVLAHAQTRTLPIYADATIRGWEPEFRQMVKENYEKVMRPQLTAAEAQRLRSVRWSFPLDPSMVAFQFWASEDGTITLPVASLLFLKDLANAQAWLTVNGYSPQTVLDYLGIIAKNRLGEWPARERLPLQALGIPEKGILEPRVVDQRNEILSKSILLVMGHELGHLVHGMRTGTACDERPPDRSRPPGCDMAKLRKSEAEADAFAVEMFRRIGLVPSAASFVFVAFSRIDRLPADFASDADWQRHAARQEHPLDAQRIQSIAATIKAERPAFASMLSPATRGQLDQRIKDLDELAQLMQDRELSAIYVAWSKTLEPQDLKPRRSIVPTLRPQPADLSATAPFTGYFRGEIQSAGSTQAQPLEVLFRGSPSSAVGAELMLMGIRGRLDGRLQAANRAVVTLDLAGDTYEMELEASNPNSIVGVYQSKAQPSARGQLRLMRSKAVP